MKKLTYNELENKIKQLKDNLGKQEANAVYWEDAYKYAVDKITILNARVQNGRRISEAIRILLGKKLEEDNLL